MAPRLEIADWTPNFLKFYEAAQNADANRRFELWKEHYGFMPLPPTPDFHDRVRQLLDATWDRYPTMLGRIRQGLGVFGTPPQEILDRVAALFERAHECAHALHLGPLGFDKPYDRTTVADHVFMEGVSTNTTVLLFPEIPVADHLDADQPEWYNRCRSLEGEIIQALLANGERSDWETIRTFVVPVDKDFMGLKRTAYYGGYRLLARLLEEHTMAEMVRIRPEDWRDTLVEAARKLGFY